MVEVNPAIIVVVALPIFRLLSFYQNILVTSEAERWRAHFCESRINKDAATHCQGREMTSSVYELLFSEVPNVLYILAPKYLT